jgi:hypothetical protein
MAHTCNSSYSGGRRVAIQSQPRQIVFETLSQKVHHKKGLVEWLKVWVLSSNSSIIKRGGRMFLLFEF